MVWPVRPSCFGRVGQRCAMVCMGESKDGLQIGNSKWGGQLWDASLGMSVASLLGSGARNRAPLGGIFPGFRGRIGPACDRVCIQANVLSKRGKN